MARFGAFELEVARRQLFKDGQEVHLTPKAFDLLAVLIEAAPRVVTKSELHGRLWPNGVVSDATLVGLVKEVRRALEDSERAPPFIRTSHRVGYAFDAPLVKGSARGRLARWLVAGERRFALADGENLIGRDAESAVWLDHATVSRRHARVVVGEAGALLEDLGSKNGTAVDGTRLVAPVGLRNGDRFFCGQIALVYHESSAAVATVTQVSMVDVRSRE